MYKLMQVKNISMVDTLEFFTVSDQNNFFNNISIGVTFNDYFPPFSKYKLKIDVNDLKDSNGQLIPVNYCMLESNIPTGHSPNYSYKRYYYFIDGIEYINEDVVSINLVMDTIQSFYHYIK